MSEVATFPDHPLTCRCRECCADEATPANPAPINPWCGRPRCWVLGAHPH